jgi:periplasmic protein TonB
MIAAGPAQERAAPMPMPLNPSPALASLAAPALSTASPVSAVASPLAQPPSVLPQPQAQQPHQPQPQQPQQTNQPQPSPSPAHMVGADMPPASLGPPPAISPQAQSLPAERARGAAGEAPPDSPARHDVAYLRNPAPTYPMASRRLQETGRVWLKVSVSAQGLAMRVQVQQSSGFERLDEAARLAVAGWRFVPARQGGEAVESSVVVPINFDLGSP